MLSYITFNTGAELIGFLTAAICLYGNKSKTWKLLIPFLFITCLTEFAGIYLKHHHRPNQWPYNILLICQIFFISLMFTKLFGKYSKNKMLTAIGSLLLCAVYIYDLACHGFLFFNELTYNTMSVLFVIYCLYFFYLQLNSDEYMDLRYSADFWWISGSLLFYFGSTAVNIFRDELSPVIVHGHSLTYYIYLILNNIFYGCWSYSFICKKWLTPISKT